MAASEEYTQELKNEDLLILFFFLFTLFDLSVCSGIALIKKTKTLYFKNKRENGICRGSLCSQVSAEHLSAHATLGMRLGKSHATEAGRTIFGNHIGSGIVGVTTSLSKKNKQKKTCKHRFILTRH